MTIYGKKRGTIYEGGCYNRSKSTRAINLLQSFIAILGKQIRGLCTQGYVQQVRRFRRVQKSISMRGLENDLQNMLSSKGNLFLVFMFCCYLF